MYSIFSVASGDTNAIHSIGTPGLWAFIVLGTLALVTLDFLITRKPHDVSLKEASIWSAFYIALPLAFGAYIAWRFGGDHATQYLTGYVVEKSLSIDNLFVFMLLLGAFAVPPQLQQRVLLLGIVGALVLRAVLIAIGAAILQTLDFAFLIFGLILLATAFKIIRDQRSGKGHNIDISHMRSVRLLRRFMPVSTEYDGPRMFVKKDGVRTATPFLLAVIAVLATDVVFAVDSVPAVYGITNDPFLVFATNAFALLGLRALYFVIHGALGKLVHLSYGLAAILAFIGIKLGLHWAHGLSNNVPEIPTFVSLAVIAAILAIATATSLHAAKKTDQSHLITERTKV